LISCKNTCLHLFSIPCSPSLYTSKCCFCILQQVCSQKLVVFLQEEGFDEVREDHLSDCVTSNQNHHHTCQMIHCSHWIIQARVSWEDC
jgi:hypothetical protein